MLALLISKLQLRELSYISDNSDALYGAVGLEERERLEHLIVKDFKNDAKGHRERLMQGHRVRGMLEQLQKQADKSVSVSTCLAGQ